MVQSLCRGGFTRDVSGDGGGRQLVCGLPEKGLLPGGQAITLVDEREDSGKSADAIESLTNEGSSIFFKERVLGPAQIDQVKRQGQNQGFEVLEGFGVVAHCAQVGWSNGLEDMFGGFRSLPELDQKRVSRGLVVNREELAIVTVCQNSVKVAGMATSPDEAWTMLDLRSLWTAPMVQGGTDVS